MPFSSEVGIASARHSVREQIKCIPPSRQNFGNRIANVRKRIEGQLRLTIFGRTAVYRK